MLEVRSLSGSTFFVRSDGLAALAAAEVGVAPAPLHRGITELQGFLDLNRFTVQVAGCGFRHTFAPVASRPTLRFILQLAAHAGQIAGLAAARGEGGRRTPNNRKHEACRHGGPPELLR